MFLTTGPLMAIPSLASNNLAGFNDGGIAIVDPVLKLE